MKYAGVIVDIVNSKLDRVFTYRIPEHLQQVLRIGMEVIVPFGRGNRTISGYVVDMMDTCEYPKEQIKEIISVPENKNAVEGRLVALSEWISRNYGSTMIQALKTVLPAKEKIQVRVSKKVVLNPDREDFKEELEYFVKHNQRARARLLSEIMKYGELPMELLGSKLNVTKATVDYLVQKDLIRVIENTDEPEISLRPGYTVNKNIELNEEQLYASNRIIENMHNGINRTYLLHGVTGSGKTEVYIKIIEDVVNNGGSAIVLIPEIALTYQTVMRFYSRFGNRISVMNSRLSKGERYHRFQQAMNGEIDVMIGPRSALFVPLPNLRLIVIDEEHELSYKSENTPRYHAVPVAVQRAALEGASVVLGSATPSLDSYYRALHGEYELLTLKDRAMSRSLARVDIVDMRQELRDGNRSIISRKLDEKIRERLENKQQIMLFLNRRGYAGFVSCRECGHVIKCSHCDVSMSLHKNGAGNTLVCHYCGAIRNVPETCPECGSVHIGVFKAGTQAVEKSLEKLYPDARILRMDMDTTRDKEGHERILSAFANREADILVGTQMIVKGHDFPSVTLVGILCADMSLHTGDYMSGERTFQLLTQAAGRAGRGDEKGQVIIQTYDPGNYVIGHAASQDYEGFYRDEMSFRELMNYPPCGRILTVQLSGEDEAHLNLAMSYLKKFGDRYCANNGVMTIGPADAKVSRIKDRFIKVLYYKHKSYDILVGLKDYLDAYIKINSGYDKLYIQYDLS